jgi:hypothetical protein
MRVGNTSVTNRSKSKPTSSTCVPSVPEGSRALKIEIPVGLHTSVKNTARDRGISIRALVIEAVEDWIVKIREYEMEERLKR